MNSLSLLRSFHEMLNENCEIWKSTWHNIGLRLQLTILSCENINREFLFLEIFFAFLTPNFLLLYLHMRWCLKCAQWNLWFEKEKWKLLTFTKLTPKQAIQPQPPSGATFFVVFCMIHKIFSCNFCFEILVFTWKFLFLRIYHRKIISVCVFFFSCTLCVYFTN